MAGSWRVHRSGAAAPTPAGRPPVISWTRRTSSGCTTRSKAATPRGQAGGQPARQRVENPRQIRLARLQGAACRRSRLGCGPRLSRSLQGSQSRLTALRAAAHYPRPSRHVRPTWSKGHAPDSGSSGKGSPPRLGRRVPRRPAAPGCTRSLRLSGSPPNGSVAASGDRSGRGKTLAQPSSAGRDPCERPAQRVLL